jgi:HEAT repeat protein
MNCPYPRFNYKLPANSSTHPTLSNSMPSLDISRAQTAADNGQWSIVTDVLQDLSLTEVEERQVVLDLALQVLLQGNADQQWEIAKIIPKLGEIAVQPLLDIVNEDEIDLEDRWAAVRLLGSFSQPEVVMALVELISQNEDLELTAIATGALTKIGIKAITALTELLATADRLVAVKILAQIRHSHTIEPLLQVVDDLDPQIRTLSIEALGSFHDTRIPPILLAKLTDTAASVRTAAVVSLSLRSDLATELDLLKRLRPLLFDLDLAVCGATALGLARLPDPEVVTVLTHVLLSSNTPNQLRSPIILALGWIGTKNAIDSLMTMLNLSTELAPEILTSISKTEQEQIHASQSLVGYLRLNPLCSAIVKQEIAAALGNLGNPETVPDLVQLLADPDDRVKLYTITAISKLSPPVS